MVPLKATDWPASKRRIILTTFVATSAVIGIILISVYMLYVFLEDVECPAVLPFIPINYSLIVPLEAPTIRTKGSILPLLCNNSVEAMIGAQLECDEEGHWDLFHITSCVLFCKEDPPSFVPFRRIWNPSNRKPGDKAIVLCGSAENGTIHSVWNCTENGSWESVIQTGCPGRTSTLNIQYCSKNPPETPSGMKRIWNKAMRRRGTVVTYVCGSQERIWRTLVCNESLEWMVIYRGHCECSGFPLSDPYASRRIFNNGEGPGSTVLDLCSQRAINSPINAISSSYVCKNRRWIKIHSADCPHRFNGEDCNGPLPVNVENSRVQYSSPLRLYGSILTVFCSDTKDDIHQTYVCAFPGQWKLTFTLSCTKECSAPPSVSSNFHRKRENSSRRLGSVVTDFCYDSSDAPVAQLMLCNASAQWETTKKFFCLDITTKGCPSSSLPEHYIESLSLSPMYSSLQVVNFFCPDYMKAHLAARLICADDGSWMTLFEKPCGCLSIPPRPPQYSYWDWYNFNHSIGTLVTYYCLKDHPEAGILRVIECSGSREWEVKEENDCECTQDPPYFPPYIMEVNESTLVMGSTVRYRCSEDPEAGYAVVVQCGLKRTWEIVARGSCGECIENPLTPPIPVIRRWNQTRVVGTVVEYYCSTIPESPVLAEAVCKPNKRWSLKIDGDWKSLIKEYCECPSDPPKFPLETLKLRIWHGDRYVGTEIDVRCRDTPEDTIGTLRCTEKRQWVYQGAECECESEPPPAVPPGVRRWFRKKALVGTEVVYACVNAFDSPLYQRAICTKNRTWIIEQNDRNMCFCPAAPPVPRHPVISNGNYTTRYHVGETVTYWCNSQKDSPIYRTSKCTTNRAWESDTERSCACDYEPPRSPRFLHRQWNGSYYFGTEVAFSCAGIAGAPVLLTIRCNSRLRWDAVDVNVLYDLRFLHCTCDRPPVLPSPAVSNWNDREMFIGSNVTYYCTKDRHAGIHSVMMCGADKKWTTVFSGSCVCKENPPLPVSPVQRVWDGTTSIGSTVFYYCTSDIESPLYKKLMCFQEKWLTVKVNSCECESKPPDPPTPLILVASVQRYYVGSQLAIRCNADLESPIIANVSCGWNKQWRTPTQEAYRKLIESCRCEEPPKALTEDIVRVIPDSYSIGSIVRYFCQTDEGLVLNMTLKCGGNNKWISDPSGPCECDKDPPMASPPTVRVWEEGKRSINTKATYLCNSQSPIVQKIVICHPKLRQWRTKVVFNRCVCKDEVFIPPSPIQMDWTNNTRSLGTTISYFCDNSTLSPLISVLICSQVTAQWQWNSTLPWKQLVHQQCECDDPPTPTPPGVHRWQEGEVHMGTQVDYFCSHISGAPVQLSLKCSVDKKWQVVYNKTCECTEEPPVPPPPIVQEWNGNARYVSTVNYYCLPDVKDLVVDVAECNASGHWQRNKQHLPWKQLFKDKCECSGEPPSVPLPVVREWNGQSRTYGTIIRYLCTNDSLDAVMMFVTCGLNLTWNVENKTACECVDPPSSVYPEKRIWNSKYKPIGETVVYRCADDSLSPVKRILKCSANRTWITKEEHSCECSDDPPSVSPPMVREWNGQTRFYTTTIRYLCTKEQIDVAVMMFVTCGPNLTWIIHNKTTCECPDPPSSEFMMWNSKIKSIGQTVVYLCSHDPMSPTKRILVCSSNRTWKTKEEHSCECSNDPPSVSSPKVREWDGTSRHYGTIIRYLCSENNTESIFMVVSCGSNLTWIVHNKTHCECPDPPLAVSPEYRFWDPNENSIGDTAVYLCSNDYLSPVKKILSCASNRTWILKKDSSCECPSDPPEAPAEFFRKWKNDSRYVGSVASYHCTSSDDSPSFAVVTCSSTLTWAMNPPHTYLSTLGNKICECSSEPPSVPKPVIREWDGLTRSIGTSIRYLCNFAFPKAIFMEVQCSNDRQWNVSKTEPCVCSRDPPLADHPNVRLWSNEDRYVGDVVRYACTSDPESPLSEKAFCNDKRQWEMIQVDTCKCLYPPPSPPTNDVIISKNYLTTIGSNVSYYCSVDTSIMFGLVRCSNKKTWQWIWLKRCRCSSDLPKPTLPASLVIRSSKIGSVAEYHCTHQLQSPVFLTAKCSSNRTWIMSSELSIEELKHQLCKCSESPPSPQLKMDLLWDGESRFLGSKVEYLCNTRTQSTLIAVTATCTLRRKWEMSLKMSWKEIVKKKCECAEPPPPPDPQTNTTWIGQKLRVGSSIIYWCDLEGGLEQMSYRCNDQRQWDMQLSMDCDDSPCSIQANGMELCVSVRSDPLNFWEAKEQCVAEKGTLLSLSNGISYQRIQHCLNQGPRTCSGYYVEKKNPKATAGKANLLELDKFGSSSFLDTTCTVIGSWNNDTCYNSKCYICQIPRLAGQHCSIPVKPESRFQHWTEPNLFCPEGWDSMRGFCFKYDISEVTSAQAQERCRRKGGDLMTIHSEAENQLVRLYLESFGRKNIWHMGLYIHNGRAIWRSGQQMIYSELSSVARTNVSCGVFIIRSNFHWDLQDCNLQTGFICRFNHDFLGYASSISYPDIIKSTFSGTMTVMSCRADCILATAFLLYSNGTCSCLSKILQNSQLLANLPNPNLKDDFTCNLPVDCYENPEKICSCGLRPAVYLTSTVVSLGCYEINLEEDELQLNLSVCLSVCAARWKMFAGHEYNGSCICTNRLLLIRQRLADDLCSEMKTEKRRQRGVASVQLFRIPSSHFPRASNQWSKRTPEQILKEIFAKTSKEEKANPSKRNSAINRPAHLAPMESQKLHRKPMVSSSYKAKSTSVISIISLFYVYICLYKDYLVISKWTFLQSEL